MDKGATPYLLACASGAPLPMLSLLERHGANVLATDCSGATALILAAYKVRDQPSQARTPLTTDSMGLFERWRVQHHSTAVSAHSTEGVESRSTFRDSRV